jgi:hypothetical protein
MHGEGLPAADTCSVARVLAGLEPVQSRRPAWIIHIAGGEWGVNGISVRFPTEDEARIEQVRLDAAALAAGYALLDETGLHAPWPEGA